MAELGELCLWAGLPLVLAAVVASFAGALSDRRALTVLGGRAMEAAFGLVVLASAGLVYALIHVQLRYAYVGSISGFQEALAWRVAGLWSGPSGGLLLLTVLVAGAAALSHRLGTSRRAAARTASLAVLTLVGLLMVLVRANPFAQPLVPAAVGAGLPVALKAPAWHVEMLATYLAVACSAFVFGGVVAGPLVARQSERRQERTAMIAVAALVTLALLASTWRAYGLSGVLFESRGFSYPLAYAPAWLLAFASLHAPGGSVVPTWAVRWRRMLEFACFPAMLGVWAAILFAAGGSPAPRLWAGGLAVGIITGAVAGAGSRDRGAEGLRDVPGYGLWAFRGGLLSLSMAGIGAVAGLSGGSLWADVAWALALLSLGLMATWSIARPAGNWKRVWVAAGPAAAVTTVVLTAIIGREGLFLAILCGLAVALAVGAAADATRLFRVRRRWRRSAADDRAEISRVVRRRSGRRRASALAHLGLAAIGVGIAAEALTQAESRVLYPGETANLSGWLGADVRVTYLGLSRYQADELEKRVATFKLERGQTGPELVTAEIVQDRKTDLPSRRPAVKSGVLYDTVVSLVDLRAAEGAMFRLAVRPLSWLVWLGGAVLLLSTFARWGRVT